MPDACNRYEQELLKLRPLRRQMTGNGGSEPPVVCRCKTGSMLSDMLMFTVSGADQRCESIAFSNLSKITDDAVALLGDRTP